MEAAIVALERAKQMVGVPTRQEIRFFSWRT
jgi:hypothetical protein